MREFVVESERISAGLQKMKSEVRGRLAKGMLDDLIDQVGLTKRDVSISLEKGKP